MASDQAQTVFSKKLNGATLNYGFKPANNPTIKMTEFQKSAAEVFLASNANPIPIEYLNASLKRLGGYSLYFEYGGSLFFGEKTPKQLYDQNNAQLSSKWGDILKKSGLASKK